MLYNSLPEQLNINGLILKPVIGTEYKEALKFVRKQKLKYRTVYVLSKNLRGKDNLHNTKYKPTVWLFAEVKTNPTTEV